MAVIVARRKRMFAGLKGRYFNSYFADNMGSLTTPADIDIRRELKDEPIGTTDTWLYRGYFIPGSTSSTWQFRTTSDDASYVWIGADAVSVDTSLNTSNAIVNNGGLHGVRTITSSNLSLTAGGLYPIAVVVGNNTGPGELTLEWSTDGSTWISDGTASAGTLLYNPFAPNGYNLE